MEIYLNKVILFVRFKLIRLLLDSKLRRRVSWLRREKLISLFLLEAHWLLLSRKNKKLRIFRITSLKNLGKRLHLRSKRNKQNKKSQRKVNKNNQLNRENKNQRRVKKNKQPNKDKKNPKRKQHKNKKVHSNKNLLKNNKNHRENNKKRLLKKKNLNRQPSKVNNSQNRPHTPNTHS